MKIADLMKESGVTFGTSGVRGLSDKITDKVAYAYTAAFLQYLEKSKPEQEQQGERDELPTLYVAGDLRPSTPRIKAAVMCVACKMGYCVLDAGTIPSPAVAYAGMSYGCPSIMVTGSHIPADRNGIKFTKEYDEISKADEQGIINQEVAIPDSLFGSDGNFINSSIESCSDEEVLAKYINRYLRAFPRDLLQEKRIGVYQHSAVGRDVMTTIIKKLGGEPIELGRSEEFVPVDTEAIRPEDVELAKKWAKEYDLFAIVSTDGDSDRPLVADETGKWMRGDVVGIITAQFLNADCVVTPVSCNSAVEEVNFKRVIRTRIGSPYVIEGMKQGESEGFKRVVGYEANGGFLIQSDLEIESGNLSRLATRDPIIVHLAVLATALKRGIKVSQLLESLPARFTASDRLKEFPVSQSKAVLEKLAQVEAERYSEAEKIFASICGNIKRVDFTDGMRIYFEGNEVIHLRPSGNAPEFRCYTEATTEARALEILQLVLPIMQTWR